MIADGYKDTEIGVIPVEWDVVKLETICDVRDGTHDSPKYQENGIPFITSKHLTDNGVDFSDVNYISNEDHINFSKRSLVENGDILFGMIGTIGKPLIVNYDFEFSIKNVALLKFKNNTKLSNSFTLNLLKSTIIDKQFSKLSNGGVQSFIALGMIRSLKIPLPPLKEQEKIADILCSADDKIDAIASQIQKAETLKIGLLQKLLSEGIGHSEFKDSELGKIPESWEVVELKKLLTFKNGVNASKEQYGKGYRFINVLDIINNLTIKHDDIIGLVDITDKEFELYEVKYGDILFQRSSETREEVGQSNVYLDKEQSATFGGFVIKGSAKQEYNPVFMNYLFKIPTIRKQITSKSGGSTRYNIGQSSLNQVVVQFPPLKEQKQIADILSTADEKLEVLRAKKQKYETLKIGLLQKLLSGELRV